METYYGIDYTVVSVIFIAPAAGYITSAIFLDKIHRSIGQRGVVALASSFRVAGYIILSQHPPYGAMVVAFVFTAFGNGIEDGAWNAWIGNLQHANEVLGFLHAAYGLGALLSPLIATAMITRAGLPFWSFFYIMIGASVLEGVTGISSFWTANGAAFRRENMPPVAEGDGEGEVKQNSVVKDVLRSRVFWCSAIFLLIYVGVEVSIGGWVVSFMITVRQAPAFQAGVSETCYWVGITVGRLILGFVTGRIGEKLAILVRISLLTFRAS